MSHSITPGAEHLLVTLTVAIRAEYSDNDGAIADGLNEMLRDSVFLDNGILADYTLHGLNQTKRVTASIDPEEGELFEASEHEGDRTFVIAVSTSTEEPFFIGWKLPLIEGAPGAFETVYPAAYKSKAAAYDSFKEAAEAMNSFLKDELVAETDFRMESELPAQNVEMFIAMDGFICPRCGSHDLESIGERVHEGNTIYETTSCDCCGATWDEGYDLDRVIHNVVEFPAS